MRVSELLSKKTTGVISVDASADLARAAHLLMEHGIGGLPVVKADGTLVGFLSERGVVEALDRYGAAASEVAVSDVMRKPAPVCGGDDAIRAVMARMTRERLRHLVVMDGDAIAGLISVGDIVKHRLEEVELEAGVLRDYVAAQRAMR